MLPDLFTALLSFGEIFSDFNFILKIFVLMTIASFARNHLGTGALSWIVIIGFAFFMFSNLWLLFGGIYLIYMLLTFGIAGILIDFFFVTAGAQPGAKMEQPVSSGLDLAARAEAIGAARGRMMPHPRRPMGPG